MRVLGVLSGNDMPLSQIEAWAKSADYLAAADGGANVLHELGISPAAAVGDLDSISIQAMASVESVLHRSDQEDSDCDKLLAFLEAEGHREVTLCNIEGDRLDHVLATLHSAAKTPLSVRIALRRGIAYVINGPTATTVPVVPGTQVSLLALETCPSACIRGVQWELSEVCLDPRGQTSLSNVAVGDVEVVLGSGSAVLFLLDPIYAGPNW